MGYFLSIIFKPAGVPLIGAAFALMWAMVLSGVSPALKDLSDGLKVIWDSSPPRWFVEAFWLQEVNSTPFADKSKPAPNGYNWDNYNYNLQMLAILMVIWQLIAFLALKLFYRSKQK